MKKMIPFLVLSCLFLFLACSGDDETSTIVQTTLTKNYMPVTKRGMSGFDLVTGDGEPHNLRTLYGKAPIPAGSLWSAAYFLVMTDQHMVDEQSPVRSTFFDTVTVFGGAFEAAFRPQEDLAPHVLNAMVQTANRLNCDYGRNLDMVLSLGDVADNGELAEFVWAMDVMDGNDDGSIAPWTGTEVRDFGPQEPFNPYLRPRYYDSNGPFPVVGLRTCNLQPLPWYGVVGNHDVLNIGNFPVDMPEWRLNNFFFSGATYVGGLSPFGYLRGLPKLIVDTLTRGDLPAAPALYERLSFYDQPLLAEAMGLFLMNPDNMQFVVNNASAGIKAIRTGIDTNFEYSQINAADPSVKRDEIGVPVVADDFRQFVGPKRLFEMLREGGHGCWTNRDPCNKVFRKGLDPDEGYYTLDYTTESGLRVPIRLIFLNTDEKPLSAVGGMSKTQWEWFKCQLDAAEEQDKLVMVVSHVPSEGIFQIPGVCLGGECNRKFVELLHSHPNVIAHLAGHTHVNAVNAKPSALKPKSGYWEVVTCSTIVWPQQVRIVEVVIYENGVGEIWSTMLDHDDTLSSFGQLNQLTAEARLLGLRDPQMEKDINNDGVPAESGRAVDRNVILRFDVPDEIVSSLREIMAPSTQIQSRDVFSTAAAYSR